MLREGRQGGLIEPLRFLADQAEPFAEEEGGKGAVQHQLQSLFGAAFGYRKETPVSAGASGRREELEVLRFPAYRSLGSLDPAFVTRRTELHMLRQLFDTLVRYDSQRGCYLPGLARRWESAEVPEGEERRFVFYLQKHVLFHDGTPMTAMDAAMTLERSRDPAQGSPYSALFSLIQRIECPEGNRHRLVLRTPKRMSEDALLCLLAAPASSVVPARRSPDFGRRPSGTGPFRVAEREEGLLALEANPDYYRRRAQLDRIEMWTVPAWAGGGQEQEAADALGTMNFRHYQERGGMEPGWQQIAGTERGCKYVVLNLTAEGPLQQVALRAHLRRIIRRCPGPGDEGPAGKRWRMR
ncbi:ABC transporter substrate-binding protein [Paenibacillus sp. P26]|nr:ABC transporter substrate-binding protein [Paenibacillus sp. P26]